MAGTNPTHRCYFFLPHPGIIPDVALHYNISIKFGS